MSDTNGFRRFSDRVLATACGLVLALVAAVWAITWDRTATDIAVTQGEVHRVGVSQHEIDRRVTTLEAQQQENARVFQRIEHRQQATEAKIDKLGEKLDQIIREIGSK